MQCEWDENSIVGGLKAVPNYIRDVRVDCDGTQKLEWFR